jgi:ferredoxin
MPQAIRVEIDKFACVGNQMCIQVAPDAFRAGADGKSEVVPGSATGLELLIQAAENCPVSAIGVFDADTGADLLD